jgi:uncharacterized protein YwgA
MNPTDFVLSLIDAAGGEIPGRTLLQKRAFFVTELTGDDFDLKFDAHYYGPYSATVEGTTTQLKNLGFLQESATGFGAVKDGFEVRRYTYSLTEDGRQVVEHLRQTAEYQRIRVAMERILSAGDPNYVELSIAAKTYFLLKRKEGGKMTLRELSKEAKKYNWNISPASVEKAADFLGQVGLATSSRESHAHLD